MRLPAVTASQRPSIGDADRSLFRLLWGGLCAYCRRPLPHDFQVDHLVPLVRGGPHHIGNLAPACPPCNARKGDQTAEEFRGEYASSHVGRVAVLIKGFWQGERTATAILCRVGAKDLLLSATLFKPERLRQGCSR